MVLSIGVEHCNYSFISNIYIYIVFVIGGRWPDTNCTATCPLSRKLFKLDEPDMQDIAGEAEMNS